MLNEVTNAHSLDNSLSKDNSSQISRQWCQVKHINLCNNITYEVLNSKAVFNHCPLFESNNGCLENDNLFQFDTLFILVRKNLPSPNQNQMSFRTAPSHGIKNSFNTYYDYISWSKSQLTQLALVLLFGQPSKNIYSTLLMGILLINYQLSIM